MLRNGTAPSANRSTVETEPFGSTFKTWSRKSWTVEPSSGNALEIGGPNVRTPPRAAK